MNYEIQEHIDVLSSSKSIRDSLLNSMVEGVLGINDQRVVIFSNKMADDIIHFIDDFQKNQSNNKSKKHLNPKELNFSK